MRSLMPILFISVALGLFYLHIDPRYEDVKVLLSEQRQYDEALDKAKELEVVRDELLTKYNALPKEELAKLERLIPNNLNTVKLITDIANIAGPFKIIPRAIKVSEPLVDTNPEVTDAAKPYKTTIITFTFASTYENLVSFLKEIETSLQLVDIKSVTFNVSDQSSGINTYEVAIQTYWVK